MSNFWARTITGLSMVFLILASLFFCKYCFSAIFLAFTILGLHEFYRLIESDSFHPQRLFGMIAGTIIFLIVTLIGYMGNLLYFFYALLIPIPFLFLSFILEIYRKQTQPIANIASTILGILYVALPLSLLSLMYYRQPVYSLDIPVYLIGYLLLTWVYDTAAYLYGKSFGRHCFFERISPKKTWEGTIAGIITALLLAMGLAAVAPVIPLADWLILSVLVMVFGTYGDLAESLFKRSLNLKDSGTLLPGHGGVLDRFDTILISAPFVFLHFLIRILII